MNKIQGRVRNFVVGVATVLALFLISTVHAQVPCASPTLDTDGDGIPDIEDNCILVANANQRDTSGTGIGNACNPDLNHDGIVNSLDLALFKTAYAAFNSAAQTYNPNADFNGDGKIDTTDLSILEKYLNKPPGPSAAFPALSLAPSTTVNFGQPFIGVLTTLPITVTNTGCRPVSIVGATLSGDPSFQVYPPTALSLVNPGQTATINVGFTAASTATVTSTLTLTTTAGTVAGNAFSLTLTGAGVNPTPAQTPTLVTPTTVTNPQVNTGGTATQQFTIQNTGTAPLVITGITSSNSSISANPSLLGGFPLTLAPGTSETIPVTISAGSTPGTVTGTLTLQTNDPLRTNQTVTVQSLVVAAPAVTNNPVTAAEVFDGQTPITASNCASVTRAITFGAGVSAGGTYQVILTDPTGNSVASSSFAVPSSAGTQVLTGINACGLADGTITVTVPYTSASNQAGPTFLGTPATKSTSTTLAPPTLTPPSQPYFTTSTANICGTARANTTVTITGGTSPVSTVLNASTTTFCLTVPLLPNAQSSLVATAVDNLATTNRASESSTPLLVTQVNPSQIVIATATSTPLSEAQVATLVENGIINLNDPQNFNFSIFTIVLTIGSFPVTVTQPVAVPILPGPSAPIVSGGWSVGGGGSGGGGSGGGSGCTESCTVVIVNNPGQGLPVIPGVLIIDGTIKTLKEFFQVTLAIQNTSNAFTLQDVASSLTLPAGSLTAVSAGLGTNVGTATNTSNPNNVSIGAIAPGATGTGQFIIRGDAVGSYNLSVAYNGTITGSGLANGIPFASSASTSVTVSGPPNLSVTVSFPTPAPTVPPTNYDFIAGQSFTLTVNITNTSQQPALYPSLDLVAGGNLTLLNPSTLLPETQQLNSLPNINPGQTVSTSFLMQANAQGYVIACQGITSANLDLAVDIQGNQNAGCNVANTLPASFIAAPTNAPPTVIGFSPPNGQGSVPVTTSIVAEFTPEAACLVGDTFSNVVTAPIDPNNSLAGIQVTSANLATQGTFYLEELDASGNAVRHVPVQLQSVGDSFNGTTVATLRLGLASPASQYFLKSQTQYRVTVVGADKSTSSGGAVCNAANQTPLAQTVQWEFQSALTCTNDPAPVASLGEPAAGSTGNVVTTPIVLNFNNSIDGTTFKFDTVNPLNDSFSVYTGATIVNGDVSGGTLVPGNLNLTNNGKTLTFTPISNLPYSSSVIVRVTNSLRDLCGTVLSTPNTGVELFSFQTGSVPVAPPAAPVVNPVPTITNLSSITITGTAAAGTTITITGGASSVAGATGSGGTFSLSVPLTLNAKNTFGVTATNTAGIASAATSTDTSGNALVTTSDQVAPTVLSTSPASGATGVAVNSSISITFSKPINTSTATTFDVLLTTSGTAVPAAVTAFGSTVTITPGAPLLAGTPYTVTVQAGGVSDLAGNSLASAYAATFTTAAATPTLTSVSPVSGTAGSAPFTVTFTGTNLSAVTAVSSANAGVSGTITSKSATSVTASITISSAAAAGVTTLGLVVGGTTVSQPFTVIAAAPTLTSLSPNSGTAGTTFTVTFTGTNLSAASAVSSANAGVSGSITSASATSVTASITISSSASTGATTLGLVIGGTTVTLPFTVNAATPTLTSLSPNSGTAGTTLSVTFTGTNLSAASAVSSGNAGVSGSITSASATSVTASITISSSASTGATTLGLVVGGTTLAQSFTVNAAATPTLTSVSATSGTDGSSFSVTFTGSDLSAASAVTSSNPGVSGTITSVSATSVTASITISPTATAGVTTLGLVVGSKTVTLSFTVNAAVPTLTALSPATAAAGTTLAVTFTGTNLAAASAVVGGEPGVTGTITAATATSVTASITIASTATVATTTLGLTANGQTVSLPFAVTAAAPTLTALSPASGAAGSTVTVVFTGTNLASATAVVGGETGVTGTITTAGATSVTTSITIASTATTGATTLGLSIGGKTYSLPFLVNAAPPTLTSLSPTTAAAGTTLTVTFNGTNLSGATAVVAGETGVTGSIVTSSPSAVTASIVIASSATPATTTLGLTVGGTTVSLPFTVTAAIATLSSVSPATAVTGTTETVTFTGTNLSHATAVISGNTGVTGTVTSATATSVVASITVTSTATTGATTLGLNVGGQLVSLPFTVNPPGPTITTLSPAAGEQGHTVAVTISGTNLSNITGISVSGTGVTATVIAGGSATSQSASFVIASAAATGVRTVTVTTAAGSATASFTVNAAPALTVSLSPSPLTLSTASTASLTVTLSDLAPTGGVTINLSTGTGLVTFSPTSVTIPANSTTAIVTVTATLTTGSDTITASGSGVTSGTDSVQVQARSFSLNAGLVGLSRTAQGSITLAQPAPTGGATIALSVANTSLVTVSPASVSIPAGQTTASFTLTGGATIGSTTLTANGSASGYSTQTATLTITNLLINLTPSQTAGFGQSLTYQAQIAPNAAPSGGVVINLASSNTNVATVPATVTIPAGAFGVNFTVQTGTTATGASIITATNANYAPTTSTVTLTAALAPTEASKTLSSTQADSVDFELTSGGNPNVAPAGGVTVAAATSNAACVKLTSTSLTVAAGSDFGSFPISYGTATLPCTASVTLSNALYGSVSVPVTYQAATNNGSISLSSVPYGVGSGLEFPISVNLSTAAPAAGATVEIRSSNPSLLLVSTSATTLGVPSLNLSFASGASNATIYLQAPVGATGTVTLTATSTSYTTATSSVSVVAPAVSLWQQLTSTTTLSGTSGFYGVVGVPYNSGSDLDPENVAPTAGSGVSVTVSSSVPAVGELQSGGVNAPTETLVIAPGYDYTGQQSGSAYFTFVPLASGSTTLSISAPGFTAESSNYGPASQVVAVTQPTMSMSVGVAASSSYGVGVGLETNQGSISLGAPAPAGGVTIQVTSNNGALVLSASGTTAGSTTLNLPIAAGQTSASFWLQGVASGAVTISAIDLSGRFSAPASIAVTITPPVVSLWQQPTTTTTDSGPSGFYGVVGVPYNGGTALYGEDVSPTLTSGLAVTVTSSAPSVGEISSAGTLTVNFDDLATSTFYPGLGLVPSSYDGLNWSCGGTPGACQVVNVQTYPNTPNGYQTSAASGTNVIGFGVDGAGGPSITFSPVGGGTFSFGSVYMTSPWLDGENVTVVALNGSTTVYTSNFTLSTAGVQTLKTFGWSNVTSVTISISGGTLHAGYNSAGAGDTALVLDNLTYSATGSADTVTIPPGYDYTGQQGGNAYFDFVPLSNGSTTISISAPGFTAESSNYGPASQVVTVSQPTMSMSVGVAGTTSYGVGAGLEVNQGSISLAAPAPAGGVTIQVSSSNGSMLLSASGFTAGATTLNLPIAAGQTSASFWLQGVTVGTATISAVDTTGTFSAPASISVSTVAPIISLWQQLTSTTTDSAPSSFDGVVGVPYGGGTDLYAEDVSPTLTGGLAVTVSSSAPTVGELQSSGGTNEASETLTIPPGYDYTGEQGGNTYFHFVPLSDGSTTLTISAPGFTAQSSNYGPASQVVTVSQPTTTLSLGVAATTSYGVGAGLETNQGSISLAAPAPAGGVTFQVTSSSANVLLSASGFTAGATTLSLPIAAGQTSASFWLQGVTAGTSTISASDTSGTFAAPASVQASVVAPIVSLWQQPTSTTPLSGTSGFYGVVGVPYGGGTDLYAEDVSPTLTSGLAVTVTSSTPSVGELQSGGTNEASQTVTIPAGYDYTGQQGGNSYFTFAPIADGTTTLTISAPGFAAESSNYGPASQVVTVAEATISLQSGVHLGSGLQFQMSGSLQAVQDGGVTVRIASSDATKLLLSPDGVTAGTPFIDIFVNNGTPSFNFYVQGIAGATGTVTLTASSPEFATATQTVAVLAPQLVFYSGLPTSESASSADAPFYIATSVPNGGYQNVAVGQSLVVTVSSSNTSVADLTTNSATQTSPVTVTIAAGQDTTPTSVATGGVALHAVAAGSTIINASAPGATPASQTVTLN